jgi:hypothetical protein
LNLFKERPAEGVLFPYLSKVRAGDKTTEFGQRCRPLGIQQQPEPMVEFLDKTLKKIGVLKKRIKNDFFPGYHWP